MLPAFASTSELAVRIPGGISDDDEARAQGVLEDASSLIRAEAGTTWVTEGVLDEDVPDIVVTVCIAAAKRAFTNPEAVTSESLGDAARSFGDASSDVYLTAAEKRLVRRAAGLASTIGSIAMEIGTPGWSGDYIDVGQTEPMPFTYEPLRP